MLQLSCTRPHWKEDDAVPLERIERVADGEVRSGAGDHVETDSRERSIPLALAIDAMPAEMLSEVASYLSAPAVLALGSTNRRHATALTAPMMRARFQSLVQRCKQKQLSAATLSESLSAFGQLVKSAAMVKESHRLDLDERRAAFTRLSASPDLMAAAHALLAAAIRLGHQIGQLAAQHADEQGNLEAKSVIKQVVGFLLRCGAFDDAGLFLSLKYWGQRHSRSAGFDKLLNPHRLSISTRAKVLAVLQWNLFFSPDPQNTSLYVPEWESWRSEETSEFEHCYLQAVISSCPLQVPYDPRIIRRGLLGNLEISKAFTTGPDFLQNFIPVYLKRVSIHFSKNEALLLSVASLLLEEIESVSESGRADILHILVRMMNRYCSSQSGKALREKIVAKRDMQNFSPTFNFEEVHQDVISGLEKEWDIHSIISPYKKLSPERQFYFWSLFQEHDFWHCMSPEAPGDMMKILSEFPENQRASLYGIPVWMFLGLENNFDPNYFLEDLQTYLVQIRFFSGANRQAAIESIINISSESMNTFKSLLSQCAEQVYSAANSEWDERSDVLQSIQAQVELRDLNFNLRQSLQSIQQLCAGLPQSEVSAINARLRETLQSFQQKI